MDREAMRQALRARLEDDTGAAIPRMDDSMSLRDDLGLDSVDVVSLVIYVQGEYGIELKSEELQTISRIGQLLDLLQTKLGGNSRKAA